MAGAVGWGGMEELAFAAGRGLSTPGCPAKPECPQVHLCSQPQTPEAQLLWQQHPLLAGLENYVSGFGTEV